MRSTDLKYMPVDVYEMNCKDCPALEECMDWGVGCTKVVTITKETGDTYTAGYNERDTEVII